MGGLSVVTASLAWALPLTTQRFIVCQITPAGNVSLSLLWEAAG